MTKRKTFTERFTRGLKPKLGQEKKYWKSVIQFNQQDDDDDDGGGGGPGKRRGGDYKREKLYRMIDQGKLKAKQFSSFLNKDRLDEHSFKGTEVTKDVPERVGKEKQQRGAKEAEKSKKARSDRVSDYLKHERSSEASAWSKAATEKVSLNELNADPINPASAASVADYAKGALGDRPYTGMVTNPEAFSNTLGFTRQGSIGLDAALISRSATQGSLPQGANYGAHHGNALGITKQGSFAGERLTGILGGNVKQMQQRRAMAVKAVPITPAAKMNMNTTLEAKIATSQSFNMRGR